MIYLVPIVRTWECPVGVIDTPSIEGWVDSFGNQKFPTNITVARYRDDLVFNIRLTDYMYVPMGGLDRLIYISNQESPGSVSCNTIINFSKKSPEKFLTYETVGDTSITLGNGISYKGLEDVRLVVWNDILYGIGFRPDVIQGKVIPQFIEYNPDYTIKRSWFLNTNKYMEKNWQPICDIPFSFVYDPTTPNILHPNILHLDLEDLQESPNQDIPTVINDIDTPEFTGKLRGSTQVIKLPDQTYISICHTSQRYKGFDQQMHWTYNHYFVQYDKYMLNPRISEPFHFIDNCMEFTCGMCMDNGNVVISFTEYDGVPHAMAIPMNKFLELVDAIMNHPDTMQNNPGVDYLVEQCHNRYCVNLPSIMALECHGVRTSTENILKSLENLKVPISYKRSILAYIIVRRRNNHELIKYYNTL